jgi:hypothetical protein
MSVAQTVRTTPVFLGGPENGSTAAGCAFKARRPAETLRARLRRTVFAVWAGLDVARSSDGVDGDKPCGGSGRSRRIRSTCRARCYTERAKTRFEHQWEIRPASGLREFAEAEAEFVGWAAARSWTSGDGPKAIFLDGMAWLRGAQAPAAGSDDAGAAGRESPRRHDAPPGGGRPSKPD